MMLPKHLILFLLIFLIFFESGFCQKEYEDKDMTTLSPDPFIDKAFGSVIVPLDSSKTDSCLIVFSKYGFTRFPDCFRFTDSLYYPNIYGEEKKIIKETVTIKNPNGDTIKRVFVDITFINKVGWEHVQHKKLYRWLHLLITFSGAILLLVTAIHVKANFKGDNAIKDKGIEFMSGALFFWCVRDAIILLHLYEPHDEKLYLMIIKNILSIIHTALFALSMAYFTYVPKWLGFVKKKEYHLVFGIVFLIAFLILLPKENEWVINLPDTIYGIIVMIMLGYLIGYNFHIRRFYGAMVATIVIVATIILSVVALTIEKPDWFAKDLVAVEVLTMASHTGFFMLLFTLVASWVVLLSRKENKDSAIENEFESSEQTDSSTTELPNNLHVSFYKRDNNYCVKYKGKECIMGSAPFENLLFIAAMKYYKNESASTVKSHYERNSYDFNGVPPESVSPSKKIMKIVPKEYFIREHGKRQIKLKIDNIEIAEELEKDFKWLLKLQGKPNPDDASSTDSSSE